MGVIGDTLSEARTRRGVDLEQIEAATGVRTRYLRAIEAEDWGVLPEEFYARSFIRKYAVFVGVAPEPLVAEYRRQRGTAGRGSAPTSPFATTTSRRAETLRRRRRRQGIYAWLGTAVFAAAVVVAIVLLAAGGDDGGTKAARNGNAGAGAGGTSGGGGANRGGKDGEAGATGGKGGPGGGGDKGGAKGAGAGSHEGAQAKTVELKVEPTAEVWACIENAAGKPLVEGVTLTAGESVGPFHSRSFTVAFGNGSVALWVDGERAHTSSSPNPIGLTIARGGQLHQLPEGERPTC